MRRWLVLLLTVACWCITLITAPAQSVIRRPITAGSCSTFPCTSVLDNFNRANEGPPPSSSWTSTIFSGDSGAKTGSNQAFSSTAPSSAYWNTSFGPDCEVYITASNMTTERPGVVARTVNLGGGTLNGYYLFVNSTSAKLYRIDSGTNTQLGADFTQTIATGDSFGMSLVGSTITVYFKAAAGSWTSLGTRTDATYSAAGKIGIRGADGTNISLADDFGGGTLP